MITGGIDIGTRNTKVAILKEGRLLGHSMVPTETDVKRSTQAALDQALGQAGLSPEDVESFGATGAGRKHVDFADHQTTDIIAGARGANWFRPSAGTGIDVGAEHSRAIKCGAEANVLDFVTNDKCAAGAGSFVEGMATALESALEDMEGLAMASQNDIDMNVTCVVFAESEVVSLIHGGAAREDIVRAMLAAVATRTVSMVRRIGVDGDAVLMGGVARNGWIVNFVKDQLGAEVCVPENPEIMGAVGAALIAAD